MKRSTVITIAITIVCVVESFCIGALLHSNNTLKATSAELTASISEMTEKYNNAIEAKDTDLSKRVILTADNSYKMVGRLLRGGEENYKVYANALKNMELAIASYSQGTDVRVKRMLDAVNDSIQYSAYSDGAIVEYKGSQTGQHDGMYKRSQATKNLDSCVSAYGLFDQVAPLFP